MKKIEKDLEIEWIKEQMEDAEKDSDNFNYFKLRKRLLDLQKS